MCVYIYIYIYIYIQTHTHTHIYTYIGRERGEKRREADEVTAEDQ